MSIIPKAGQPHINNYENKTLARYSPYQAAFPENKPVSPAPLMAFDATGRTPWAIPFDFKDYLELVDWTGRVVHPLKLGYIPDQTPALLKRLNINHEQFITHADHFLKDFGTAVGAPKNMVDLCSRRQIKFLRGITASKRLFNQHLAA